MLGTTIAGTPYTEVTAYDGYGRLMAKQDATGETLTNNYSTRGHLASLSDSRYGTVYEVFAMTARGQVAEDRRGASNNLKGIINYNAQSGRIHTVCSGDTNCHLQDLRYAFDLSGNLFQRERQRSTAPTTEEFTHDALNRLLTARLVTINGIPQSSPPQTTTIAYDKLGNICSKDGFSYTYTGRAGCPGSGPSGSPHAVASFQDRPRSYDANGSLVEIAGDRWFEYNALNELSFAYNNKGLNATFKYSPSGDRFLQVLPTGNIVHYVGNVEFIRSTSGADVEMRRTLAGVAIDLNRGREPRHVRYVFSDHLGSIDAVAGATGALLEAASFDVHGNRRDATSWKGSNGMLPVWSAPVDRPSTTPRGFTSHEHIDGLAFIHMNGRTYDPASGRMMQADPLVDGSPQGLNRYSYVANNPLALTDPTGYSAWGDILRAVVAIAVIVVAPYLAAVVGPMWAAAITGFVSGVITTGTLQGGIYGAFSAMLFCGIGSAFETAGSWATRGNTVFGTNLNAVGYTAKVVAHGMAGGTMSVLQGGKFGNGFASAGVAQAFSGAIDSMDPQNPVGVRMSASRVIAVAAVGGTTSVIAGGKFANGAVTAAFSRAFNDEMEKRAQDKSRRPKLNLEGIDVDADIAYQAYNDIARHNRQSIIDDTEYGVVRTGSGLEIGVPDWSTGKVQFSWLQFTSAGDGMLPYSIFNSNTNSNVTDWIYFSHTHGALGNGSQYFSRSDMLIGNITGRPVFMGNSAGNFYVYLPGMNSAGKLLCRTCLPK